MRLLAALMLICAISAGAAVPFRSTRPLTGMRPNAFKTQNACPQLCPISQCTNAITAANNAVCTELSSFITASVTQLQQAGLPAACATLSNQLLCPVLYGASDYFGNVISCDVEKSKDVPARLCQSACDSAIQQLIQCAHSNGKNDLSASSVSVLLNCEPVVFASDCMSAEGRYVPPADDSNDEFMSSSSTTGIVLGVALCLLLIAAGVVICYNRYKGRPMWQREGSAALQLREQRHQPTDAEGPEAVGGGTYMNGHTGAAIVLHEDDSFRERPPLPPGPPPDHVVERTLAREREDASLLSS